MQHGADSDVPPAAACSPTRFLAVYMKLEYGVEKTEEKGKLTKWGKNELYGSVGCVFTTISLKFYSWHCCSWTVSTIKKKEKTPGQEVDAIFHCSLHKNT